MANKHSDARARFAQRLRAIRIPRGYKTARSFAEALDIDENRYTRYERAEVEPDLRLLMRICTLLDATPNDLLCDTIGTQPLELEVPYGFSERSGGSYQTAVPQARLTPASDSLNEARKAAAWELASLVAIIEAQASGQDPDSLPVLEKLRRTSPIHARITTDIFKFLQELPDRLHGIEISPEHERQLDDLTQEIVAAGKTPSNDNG